MEDRVILTKKGYEKLQRELEELETIERQKVAEMLKEARSHGDISENAEYDAAKEYQAHVEARINKIRRILEQAEIYEEETTDGTAAPGCRVTLKNLANGKEISFELVGYGESDPGNGKITISSPIGRAVLGCRAGETIEVEVPAGKIKYEIVRVENE